MSDRILLFFPYFVYFVRHNFIDIGNGAHQNDAIHCGDVHRRGFSVGRGTCPFLPREERSARPCFVLLSLFCANLPLPFAREAAWGICEGDGGTLRPRGEVGAHGDLSALLCSLRGNAGGLRRSRADLFAPSFPLGACRRAPVFEEGNARHHSAQLHSRARARRLCADLRARRNARFPPARGGGNGRAVCGHERLACGARSPRRRGGGGASRALCAPCLSSHLSLRVRGARRCLSGGGERDRRRTSLPLRHAGEQNILCRLGACHRHLARLRALSASCPLRSAPFSQNKKRRAGVCTRGGVLSVEIGAFGHRPSALSRARGSGTCLFNSLYFLRVSFREAPQGSTFPRQARKGSRSPSSQGRV